MGLHRLIALALLLVTASCGDDGGNYCPAPDLIEPDVIDSCGDAFVQVEENETQRVITCTRPDPVYDSCTEFWIDAEGDEFGSCFHLSFVHCSAGSAAE